ncbi:DDE-1 domain-containing protein, partial [Durusdinium trenchii]
MVALRFIVELQLLSWVQFQNYECGVAPSRKMLLDHAQSCAPKDLPPSLTARLLRPFKTARSQRKALAAFRMKHRCKLGKLRSEAPIPLAEKQDKALAFYQWCNYWQANTEREPLLINMDESSLAFHWSGLAGTVAEAAVSVATDKAKLSSRRARVTYLCCITHDSTVQPLLPQVLLGNSRSFPLEFVKQAAEVEPGITVWREKSAWNSHRLMRKFLRLLCARLGDLLKTRSVGLLLDFAPCHVHDSIFELARSAGLRLLFVPPGMTPLLQPCDTHCFAAFKNNAQENWRVKKSEAGGHPTLLMWFQAVAAAVHDLVHRSCARAFESDGILQQQRNMSSHLLKQLHWSTAPQVPPVWPSEEVATLLFPRN